MQTKFFSWYSSMELNGDESIRSVRWAQVQAAAKAPSRTVLETLTRLTFRTKVADADAGVIRTLFTAEASPAPGDPELHLLAAATLAVLVKRCDATAAKAAMFIASASCAGQRELQQPMDLVAHAVDALTSLSETVRRRPQLELELEKPVNPQVDAKVVTDAVVTLDMAGIHAGFTAVTGAFNKALTVILKRQKSFESAVQEYVRVQDEELDVLWWLHGEHCEIRETPFHDVPEVERPLIFAKDLAELTRVLPGPPAIKSLLSRSGIDDNAMLSIHDVVQALPVKLLLRFVPDDALGKVSVVTTPILEAIRRRQEVDGRDAWAQTWAAVCGLKQDTKLPALRLAEAAYRELLLVKFG